MRKKLTSTLFVAMMLSMTWANVPFASATTPPSTSLSISSAYNGTIVDNGFVYTSAAPNITLSVANPPNSTFYSTEYTIGVNGNITPYQGPFTLNLNYSSELELRYRSNGSSGLESWKSLTISVDADAPSISMTSAGASLERFVVNRSVLLTSNTVPLRIVCLDSLAGIESMSGQIHNLTVTSFNGSFDLLPQNHQSLMALNQTMDATFQCTDRVGNQNWYNFSFRIDSSPPQLTTLTSGYRNGVCTSSGWTISGSSLDSHSDSFVQILENGTWQSFVNSLSFSAGFNGTIHLRATDQMGFSSNVTQWNIFVDDSPPVVNATLSSNQLQYTLQDDCQVSETLVRWEAYNGNLSSWYQVTSGVTYAPSFLNGSIIRAHIQAEDELGNTVVYTTEWAQTNGSMPFTSVYELSNTQGTFATPQFSVLLTPQGLQSSTTYTLYQNNQSVQNGNISGLSTVGYNYSNGDLIRLYIVTHGALNATSYQNHSWTADGGNQKRVAISMAGSFINTSALVLGPTGYFQHTASVDDVNGVGGDYVECTSGGGQWARSLNSSIQPAGIVGQSTNFNFGCRPVDLLGNRGQTTWANGTLDFTKPTITISPASSSLISPVTLLQFQAQDSTGVFSSSYEFTWSNGTNSLYQNYSLAGGNWSTSVSQLFSQASDGIVSVKVTTIDQVGNSRLTLGHTWQLNTSSPLSSVELVNTSGAFLPPTNSTLRLSPPGSGWPGIWMNYSFEFGTSTLFSGNTSSFVSLQPNFSIGGNAWLNVTTGDMLGRNQTQQWIFMVDTTNAAIPQFSVEGLNITNGTQIRLGPSSKIKIANVVDDSAGVGGATASCSFDSNSWFSVENGGSVPIYGLQSASQPSSLQCKNIDLFGNSGPLSNFSFHLDSTQPSHSLIPNVAYITPYTPLEISAVDPSGISSSLLELQWSDGSNIIYRNITRTSTAWNTSIQSLFGTLQQGVISASLTTTDLVGNVQISLGYSWMLTTQQPTPLISVSGDVYGSHIATSGASFTIGGASGGVGTHTINYTVAYTNGTLIGQGTTTSQAQFSHSNLQEGQLEFSVTISDSYGRTQNRSWFYTIDGSVSALPQFTIEGLNTSMNSQIWLGPSSSVVVGNLLDSPGGVGYQMTQCSWEGSSWFTASTTTGISPIYANEQHTGHELRCKHIDLLGNIGGTSWFNFSVDAISPTHALTPASQSAIAPTSMIAFSSSDVNGIWYSEMNLTWSDGANMWHETVDISANNWTGSLQSLRSNFNDGTVGVQIRTFDRLGNLNTTTSIEWELNTSTPVSLVSVEGDALGSYVGNNFSFTISPPSHGGSPATSNITIEANGGVILTTSTNSTTTYTYTDTTNLLNGSIFLNITTLDALGRTHDQVFQYIVDRTILTVPSMQFVGRNTMKNGAYYLGPSAGISLSVGSDDVGGVGLRSTSCSWDGSSWFNASSSGVLLPSSTSGSVQAFQLRCLHVDLLGNLGPIVWSNGSVDAEAPTTNFGTPAGTLLSESTVLTSSCSDLIGCTMTSINAKFTVGNSVSWHQRTLSGQNASHPVSGLFTATSQGTVTFYMVAEDDVGNVANISTTAYEYVHGVPTVSVSIDSEHYMNYITSNLSFTVQPSTGWLTGITANLSVEHLSNSTELFNSTINQSTSVHNFMNLTEGQVRVIAEVCDQLFRCTQSVIILIVDRTGPSAPQISIPAGYALSNGSVIGRAATQTTITSGGDVGSMTSETVCSSEGNYHNFTASLSVVSFISILNSNDWATLSCVSIDSVGNIGNQTNLTLFRDDVKPDLVGLQLPVDGVIVPSTELNYSCADSYPSLLAFSITSEGSTVYTVNSSGSISSTFGDILPNLPNSNIQISVECEDAVGNLNLSTSELEWLPYLAPSSFSIGSGMNGNISYIGGSSEIQINNPRQDVVHHLRFLEGGQTSNWTFLSSLSFDVNDLPFEFVDNDDIQFELRVSKNGTALHNTTFTPLLRLDFTGPVMTLSNASWYGNSTLLGIDVMDAGINTGIRYHWSFDNGTEFESSDKNDVIFPSSTSQQVWFTIRASDYYENIGNSTSSLLNRDFTSPQINFTQSTIGYIGMNSDFQISVYESTGLQSSSIFFEIESGDSFYLANNTSSLSFSTSDLPAWLLNESSITLKVEAVAQSQLVSSFSAALIIDQTKPFLSIDQFGSNYISSWNTSNHSSILFTGSSDIQGICYKIATNTSSLPAECPPLVNNTLTINRSQGAYLIYVFFSDFAGNSNQSIFALTHHTQPPTASVTLPPMVRPTQLYTVGYSTAHNPVLTLKWDGLLLSHSSGLFAIPASDGTHELTMLVMDDLGLSNSFTTTIQVDAILPALGIEGLQTSSFGAGTNTTLWFNSSDANSTIDNVRLNVSDGSISCEFITSPVAYYHSLNGTMSDIFSNTNCSLLTEEGIMLTIVFEARDHVGNLRQTTTFVTYYGSISPPEYIALRSNQLNATINIGPDSSIQCLPAVGAVSPVIEVEWTGVSGSFNNSTLTNVTTDGVITCSITDAFGNSAQRSQNLSYDFTPPSVNIVWPESTYGTFVRSSGPSFTFTSFDSEAPIYSMLYCISNQSCVPNIPSNGSTQFNGTTGLHYLTILVENELGVTATNTTAFTLDNTPPWILLNPKSNASLLGSILFIGLNSSQIELSVGDNYCLASATLETNQGQVSLAENTLTNHSLQPYSTYARVTVTDCVGHSVVTNYTIQTVTSIQPSSRTLDSSHIGTAFFNGSDDFVFDGSVLLRTSSQHPLPLNLTCQTSTGWIVCDELQTTNQFQLTINASQNGMAIIKYIDAVGNTAYQNFSFWVDNQGPVCTVQASAVINGNNMLASSQFSSEFSCLDLNEVSAVAWVSTSSTISWTQLNGHWIAPPPQSSNVDLRAIDELGNTVLTPLNVQFDDTSPLLTYTNITGVSFSEGYAQSDGSFDVACYDALQSPCYILVEQFTASGIKLTSINYTNSGSVLIESKNEVTELIRVTTNDQIGNLYSQTDTLIVDDQAPLYSISWANSRVGIELSSPAAPADGIIRIENLNAIDVNISTSFVQILCPGRPMPILNTALITTINLGELYLEGCAEIELKVSVFDHAGNLRLISNNLSIDHVIPFAEMSLDAGCSWFSGTRYDATPLCILEVDLTDDTTPLLLGSYQLYIQSINSEKNKSITFSSTISSANLVSFNEEDVLISITGHDTVGNQITSTPIQVSLRTDFYPKWVGVSCVGQSQCPLTGEVKMTPGFNAESIGFSVREGEAPIIMSNLNFTRGGVSTFPVTSPLFDANSLEEGEWMVTGDFKDAAGRVFTIDNLQIIYDTSFPTISIDTSRSTGYLADTGSILSCDVCSLVFRVNDVTELDLIINQNHYFQGGYFVINTSALSNGSIVVSVTDEFQRNTNLSLPILALASTTFEASGYTGGSDVKTFCLEGGGSVALREVVCLWRREGVGLVDLPIPLTLFIDKPELREVRLTVVADETRTSSVPVSNGVATLPNIPYYTSQMIVSLDDSFSDAKPMRIRLIEHTEPWTDLGFVNSQLNETDTQSTFNVRFTPPASQEQFYMIKGGNAGVDDWLECSSTYQFAEVYRSIPKLITDENCEIDNFRLKPDGSMQVKITINHSSIRINSGLNYHVNPLFNLASFAIQFEYSDQLGVMERTDVSDLSILSDQILRATDLPSSFDKGACQLGYDASTTSLDGFLQSDSTLSLNSCMDSFEDQDGIEAIVWNMTFFNSVGVKAYNLEIQCSGTFFPLAWAFQDAFNSGRCSHPGQPFPSGVYDVRVRPIILDGSMYSDEGSSQLHYSPLLGNQTQCGDQESSCYVQLSLNSVTVYSSFDPALEVENAAEFVSNWKAKPGFSVFVWNIFFVLLLAYFVRTSRKKP